MRNGGEAHELEILAIEAGIVIDDGGLVDEIQCIVPEGSRKAISKIILVTIPSDDRETDIIDHVVFASGHSMGVVANEAVVDGGDFEVIGLSVIIGEVEGVEEDFIF